MNPHDSEMCLPVCIMGRKRFSVNTQRNFSHLKSVVIADDGDVFTCVRLEYSFEYTIFISNKDSKKVQMRKCSALNEGFAAFRI